MFCGTASVDVATTPIIVPGRPDYQGLTRLGLAYDTMGSGQPLSVMGDRVTWDLGPLGEEEEQEEEG